MFTFPDMDSAFAAAQRLANKNDRLFCVMARNARNQLSPWGICSDNQATVYVNDCWSDWSHWANVRPVQSPEMQPELSIEVTQK